MSIKAIGPFEPNGSSKHQRDYPQIALDAGDVRVNVPSFTRVEFSETIAMPDGKKRDRFEVLDFEHKGKKAYLSHSSAGSRLIDPPKYYGPCLVDWDKARGSVIVSIPSDSTIPKVTATATSLPQAPDGTYKIRPRINEYKNNEHEPFVCESYQPNDPHACHWWALDDFWHEGYCLHRGNTSLGCISVNQVGTWESIYKILAFCRTSDGRFSGEIRIRGHNALTS